MNIHTINQNNNNYVEVEFEHRYPEIQRLYKYGVMEDKRASVLVQELANLYISTINLQERLMITEVLDSTLVSILINSLSRVEQSIYALWVIDNISDRITGSNNERYLHEFNELKQQGEELTNQAKKLITSHFPKGEMEL